MDRPVRITKKGRQTGLACFHFHQSSLLNIWRHMML